MTLMALYFLILEYFCAYGWLFGLNYGHATDTKVTISIETTVILTHDQRMWIRTI